MATFVELKNILTLELLQVFKTQQDTKFQAKLDEKEALGTAATLVGALAELQTTAKDTVVAAINEVKAATVTNATAISTLDTKVGTLPEDATDVVSLIDTKIAAVNSDASDLAARVTAAEADIDAIEADYLTSADKTALQEQITTNKNAIDVLNGTGDGSVDKKISDAINKFATDVTDDGVVNSFKELVDWAATHGSEASEMAANITANANAIDALTTKVGTIPTTSAATDVIGYVDEQVAAEKARAEAAEKANADAISALQTQVGEGGSVADSIATAKSEAITAAKNYTDEEVAKDRERLTAAESDIDALEAALGEGGSTKTAIEAAQAQADAAKEKADANAADITALTARVSALETWAESITLATEADILAMFA